MYVYALDCVKGLNVADVARVQAPPSPGRCLSDGRYTGSPRGRSCGMNVMRGYMRARYDMVARLSCNVIRSDTCSRQIRDLYHEEHVRHRRDPRIHYGRHYIRMNFPRVF